MADSTSQPPSPVGKFIQTYSSFLSTFVIGAAGLVATSIWQYRQSEISARQAETQQRVALTQAENSWRIERAEILSKNLGVLSSSGPDTVEQRYGVLLSLTRGSILEADLAVSYALELGKDSPDYMRSVLASIPDKSYARLANAFELTCAQRFGFESTSAVCLPEPRIGRAQALTELFDEEIDAARRRGQRGPLELLLDARLVQAIPLKLAALFSHHLLGLLERRQFSEIEQFAQLSSGARLIAGLVLAPTASNVFVAATDAPRMKQFHEAHAEVLRTFLYGSECNGECKGKLLDIMLTSYDEAEGRYDRALRELFTHPRAEVAMGLARLQARLLQCQVDLRDARALRDGVLVPALLDAAKAGPEAPGALFDDLLSLLALTIDPTYAADQATVRAAWDQALALARKADPVRYDRAFTQRRRSVQGLRKKPPAKLREMLCSDDDIALAESALDE